MTAEGAVDQISRGRASGRRRRLARQGRFDARVFLDRWLEQVGLDVEGAGLKFSAPCDAVKVVSQVAIT